MSGETRAGLPILRFADAAAFDAWLAAEPRTSGGCWLRLAKKGSDMRSVSKPDAIDAALCHGWIDGQQDRYDDASWLTRFTPRRRASRWSQINRARAVELLAEGRIAPAGLAEIEAARTDGRWDAAYAPASTAEVPADLREALDRSPAAAAFAAMAKTARYAILHRVGTVKHAETRARKIAEFVQKLETGEASPASPTVRQAG